MPEQFPYQRFLPTSPLMPTPLESIADHLRENDWNFEEDAEHKVISTSLNAENCQFRVHLAVNDSDDVMEVVSQIPSRVPAEKRVAVAELCARANFGIKLARLELDFTDGELRSYASAPFVPGVLPDEVVKQCLAASILVADHFYPAIMSVLFAGVSPEVALDNLSVASKEPSEEDASGRGA